MRRAPAVNVDNLARDVGGVIEQETHRTRNILRTSCVLEQSVGDDVFACFRIECAIFRPQNGAGGNRVDAHVRRQFDGQSLGQAKQAGLCRAIEGIAGKRSLGMDIRNIDDRSMRFP